MTDRPMDKLDAANAPRGLPSCPNCALREAAPIFNTAGGDFWYCTATPLIPAFGGAYLTNCTTGRVGGPINLKLFDPASIYAANLNARRCPLFEQRALANAPAASE